jgi:glycerol-1-phosphate dehydrogenase [NAD(P)+]
VVPVTDASPLIGQGLAGPTRDLIRRGPGVLRSTLDGLDEGFTVITQPGPHRAVADLYDGLFDRAGTVLHATGLAAESLEELVSRVPADQPVVGIGGGVVMDSAKWAAFEHRLPLYATPSAISVDAAVTNTVAVRDSGRVTYRGFVVPEAVIVDVDVIRTAPDRANRAGIGDLLSIHTALFDWRLGQTEGGAPFDAGVAERARGILEATLALAPQLSHGTEDALVGLVEGYADINDMTVSLGHAQMEEGSEHYLAYLLEQMTGREFVHGEVVTLGTVLLSHWQQNRPERVVEAAEASGVRWRPAALDLDDDLVMQALAALPRFTVDGGYPYSVVNERPLDVPAMTEVLRGWS